MTNTHIIELDFSHEYSFGELLDDIQPYNLTAQIVELDGPAGGNPLLSLSGTYDNIFQYLHNAYCHDLDDALYHAEDIKTL